MPASLTLPRVKSEDELRALPATPIQCANWPQYPGGPRTTVRAARLGDAIALLYTVEETKPRAVAETDHGPVWEDSCVEFFCQIPGDPRYFNFEFNSKGIALATSRQSRNEGKLPFTQAQMAQIGRTPAATDNSWSLLVTIPLSLIGLKPQGEHRLMANFYKCGDLTDEPHFLSWSPIATPKPDFHRPEFFSEIHIEA